MRILVAGGQGQVGSALAELGVEHCLDLIALGSSELDITDVSSIAQVYDKYKPGLLINAAAYTAVDKAEFEPELAYEINETGTSLLADVCAKNNIPMLHISTDYVFDGLKEEGYTEDDTVNPLAMYAKSKEAGERAVRERLDRHIILRTSWVFGVQGNNFVKTIVRLAQERNCLTVVSDQFGGPSSARGIALALLTMAAKYRKNDKVTWGTYHYCQKPYVSWHQFAQVIIKKATEIGLVTHDVEIVPIPGSAFSTAVRRPPNSRLSVNKIEELFDLTPISWVNDIDDVLLKIKSS
ncbi:dTDP-4-dehydrorhamnose reductase [Oceanospirillaceae bacterium]|nr:dTDP-4-dehydrorhamnose reductase [Oceanospirillaceae bacterium]